MLSFCTYNLLCIPVNYISNAEVTDLLQNIWFVNILENTLTYEYIEYEAYCTVRVYIFTPIYASIGMT